MHSAIVDVAGSHLDGKNTPGSYSALIVFETGEPFCGSYYMLPQYHMGLDVRQGQQPACACLKHLILSEGLQFLQTAYRPHRAHRCKFEETSLRAEAYCRSCIAVAMQA